MSYPSFNAFTIPYTNKVNVLVTQVGVSLPYNPNTCEKNEANPPITSYYAIWDTGATNTCITKKIANNLGLVAIGKIRVNTAGGTNVFPQYLVNIYLPNDLALIAVAVTACDSLSCNCDFLIGMDVIGRGDFSVTHADDKTTMSFRIPSVKKVDYVAEANALLVKPQGHGSPNRSQTKAKRKKEKQNQKKNKKK